MRAVHRACATVLVASFTLGGLAPARAQGGDQSDDRQYKVETRTKYDYDLSSYITRGSVRMGVPFRVLARVASEFSDYRKWSLRGINGEGENKRSFITLLRDVRWKPGGKADHGIFEIILDVDLIWPLGSKGETVSFDIVEADPAGGGAGIDKLAVELRGENLILNTFNLTLVASGDEKTTVVGFVSRVQFASIVDSLFSMERYKENIEWRIVKVIKNLARWVELQAKSPSETLIPAGQ